MTVGQIDAKQEEHHIEPVADMEISALTIAYTEDSEYGGINSGTNDVHLSEIGVHGLDIVDAHGDEREAGRIDQHVEYGSLIVAFRPKFPPPFVPETAGPVPPWLRISAIATFRIGSLST